MKVDVLKEILRLRGLKVTGNKSSKSLLGATQITANKWRRKQFFPSLVSFPRPRSAITPIILPVKLCIEEAVTPYPPQPAFRGARQAGS